MTISIFLDRSGYPHIRRGNHVASIADFPPCAMTLPVCKKGKKSASHASLCHNAATLFCRLRET